MLNSSTLYQDFVHQVLEIICKQFPKSIVYHYFAILFEFKYFRKIFKEVKKNLPNWGLQIVPKNTLSEEVYL